MMQCQYNTIFSFRHVIMSTNRICHERELKTYLIPRHPNCCNHLREWCLAKQKPDSTTSIHHEIKPTSSPSESETCVCWPIMRHPHSSQSCSSSTDDSSTYHRGTAVDKGDYCSLCILYTLFTIRVLQTWLPKSQSSINTVATVVKSEYYFLITIFCGAGTTSWQQR